MTSRKLFAEDAVAFQGLRLRALLDRPGAFISSQAREAPLSIEEVAARHAATVNRAVFGPFNGGRLISMAGLGRGHIQNVAHKASVWGMWVEPNCRRLGWAQHLLDAAIEFAAQVPGIRQVKISVYDVNDKARCLSVSSGFVPFRVEPCSMQIGDACYDEEPMVRILSWPAQ